ncbi:hypothetical protein AN191_00125 [Loktanella sp. 5RATIMAR09]|uniref:hypothetical protein n=1 Tax=Loktanella sp. 5RATIMAR09 TaxID=1225655 RepID=UPI0006EBC943|nr:hypothetical protein [Loktanella sp. 5RATIMAR09]KQI73837.1 hypothetical protein AN191_00125 [Loktanella sp. 5RATIMAR09]
MVKRIAFLVVAPALAVLAALGLYARDPAPLDKEAFEALYAEPAPRPDGPRQVFHIGHSLVGRDMPAMLAQLAGEGHDYASQLGWGATLKSHWEPDVAINGFAEENAHAKYRDAHEAVESGDYNTLVLTEMVEIKDAIRYFDSPTYVHRWAEKAQARGLPVYLYETWHPLNDETGWLTRLDQDLGLYWEDAILRPALARAEAPQPVYLIPGGQVMAALARALENQGPVGPLASHEDLFGDNIHFNDYGAYLIALTHYAVLYQQSPVGLPYQLVRADGTPADDPGAAAARLMQNVVWDVVTSMPRTGVRS